MVKYKDVRVIALEELADQKWHTIQELQEKCESLGIDFEGNKSSLYNVLHQLKKKNILESSGTGDYKLLTDNTTQPSPDSSGDKTAELKTSIKTIESYINKYKKFDWINCSEQELHQARNNVAALLTLSGKIDNEFKR